MSEKCARRGTWNARTAPNRRQRSTSLFVWARFVSRYNRGMKITYAVATSRDGFIAREDGDVSWLDDVGIQMDETGLAEFFDSVDGLIMGRATYNFVWNYGTWPYGDKPTWVCTHRKMEMFDDANLIIVDSIHELMSDVRQRRMASLWLIGGAKLASSFLEAGLISNVSITELPVDLGSGISLFDKHELADIAVKSRDVIEKQGFRQIEISIESEL